MVNAVALVVVVVISGNVDRIFACNVVAMVLGVVVIKRAVVFRVSSRRAYGRWGIFDSIFS